MRLIVAAVTAVVMTCGMYLAKKHDTKAIVISHAPEPPDLIPSATHKTREALTFAKTKNFDTTLAIGIDYSIHSGRKRGFIINLQTRQVMDSFLVSHGCGIYPWSSDRTKDRPQFSNNFESHCSSLGKYRIGKKGYSNWGIHVKYFLYGLDSSNSNAWKRSIVLHGWADVPDHEIYPSGTPEGWGCPAVSDHIMQRLDSFLQSKTKPVLLWMYLGH
jgi:hypothetical protein